MFVYIMLAFPFLLTAACFVISYLGRRWVQLPHFLANFVGGNLAICSVTDFERALRSSHVVTGNDNMVYVVVPETLLFTNKQSRLPGGVVSGALKHLSGSDPWIQYPYVCGPAHHESRLFVPFASEALVPFEAQLNTFISPPDNLKTFEKQKVAESLAASFRRRFASWYTTSKCFGAIYFYSTSLAVALFAISFINYAQNYNSGREEIVFLNTDQGDIASYDTKFVEGKDIPVIHEGGQTDYWIYRGIVTTKQYLGGGIYRVCADTGNERRDCMMSGFDVVVGQTVHYRMIDLTAYSKGPSYFRYSNTLSGERFTVSVEEVEKLVETDKFRIVD